MQEKDKLKIPSLGITVRHHSASLVMLNSNPRVGSFNPHLTAIKGERNHKAFCTLKKRALQTMNFDTNLIKIGGELRKLWTTEYLNFVGMGAATLNIK